MTEEKHKILNKELQSLNLRLPSINKMIIKNITDGDNNLDYFLLNSFPEKVKCLSINKIKLSGKCINISFYINSLIEAVNRVSKEIYIEAFELSNPCLQKFIKASKNCERLVLRYCNIHCSKALDFTTASPYNIKYLSFFNCGKSGRKSDWISNPSMFENIIAAIAKCGLKDTLQTVEIGGCGLDLSEVKEIFSTLGMPNISLIASEDEPAEQ